ncbi:MAG: aspartate-semialdehyde dehydrogenase [Flavobacteriales bacterium]|nr:aspartate-semialdehyde dehydrogenase [Flavobacteriales bacterium]
MRIAVIGATGLVGNVMLKVLAERSFPISQLYLVASERSVGKEVVFGGIAHKVIGLAQAVSLKPDIAIFSAGGATSKEWAPKFAQAGTTVIDNSSAWRMDPDIKLVVPEINGDKLTKADRIIANPNCSTIQMVLALRDIHRTYGIERLVISTYQSVSGTGADAIAQLEGERNGSKPKMVYPYPIDMNCLPHGGDFDEDGNTTEELKLIHETRKILDDESIQVTATVVRVPVKGGHSESVNIETKKPFELLDVRSMLARTPGVKVQDMPETNTYPMPLYAEGKDEVFVGRIRRDTSRPNAMNMWIVSDNLRKGAATNAVQIAEVVKDLLA